MKATTKFPYLSSALDQQSYEWLATECPDILTALEKEVARGAGARELYLLVSAEYGRPELAKRIEAAARHLTK